MVAEVPWNDFVTMFLCPRKPQEIECDLDFDVAFDYDCDVILPVCRSGEYDEAAVNKNLMRNPGLHKDVSWGVPQDGILDFFGIQWFLPCPLKLIGH